MNIALILFGGNGTRFGETQPKQFFLIKNKPLCYYTIKSFNDSPLIDEIVLVIDKSLQDKYEEIVKKNNFDKVKSYVQGGCSRQESSYLGLSSLKANDDDIVLIHDGARPLVSNDIIENNIELLKAYDGVVTAIQSEDTIAIAMDDKINNYTNRAKTFRVQTPQSFKYGVILCAHRKYANESLTDDAQLLLKENGRIGIAKGDKKLLKVTTKEDLKFIEDYLNE